MPEPVIRVRDLEKRYRVWSHAPPTNLKERLQVAGASLRARAGIGEHQTFRHDVWALRGVSFDVGRGEVLGVIGRNGAGKSTLLSILARITEPTAGYAEIHGRVSSLLEVGTGFHPELTGRDNVFLNGAILGMPRSEIAQKFDEIVEFSGIGEFIDIPVKRYSSGMQVRLAFAVGAQLDPEILLLDEVLAVGDSGFQARCHARVEELTQSGRTVLFVSHDVRSVARLCRRVLVLEEGRVAFEGTADESLAYYLRHDGGSVSDPGARRPGSGEVRVRRVTGAALDGTSHVTLAKPFRLVVEIDAARPVRLDELSVALSIERPGVGQYVVLETEGPGRRLPDVTVHGTSTLVCEVQGLPLKPDTYSLSASVRRGQELLDSAARIAELTLVADPGDERVSSQSAPVVVRHAWSTLEAASGVTASGDRPGEVASVVPR
jgi:homopolymeric O-antigen transport system ATP-binding protein